MKRALALLVLIGIITATAGFFYIKSLLSAVDPNDQQTKLVVVNKGQTLTSVAEALVKEGLLRSPISLKIASYQSKKGTSIQAGSFRLSPSMTPAEILENLSHGKLDIWVTIIEGWRREEIAEGLAKSFTAAGLSFDQSKFLDATKGKEGYLFPDTYLFPISADEKAVASILETTLNKKLSGKINDAIKKSGKTLNQVLTMASIVEREARTEQSRKMVAGILWNRIEIGMPLQADATLQYAKGFNKIQGSWWVPPLAADKDIASPYNTYKNAALPPNPICSPSLGSIEATVFPTASSYWYYITDNDGQMHYAKTLDEHNQNVNRYLR